MHSKFVRLALFCGSLVLLGHSGIAQIIPAPTTPSPIPNPIPGLIGPTPNPSIPPVTPPPTPTIPPASPPPTPPTIIPLPPAVQALYQVVTQTSPPPILKRPDPQRATAVIRYGQGSTLVPKNDQGRFQKVALQPQQVVTVVVSLGLTEFGKPADVQILDGGAISSEPSLPGEDKLPPTPTPYPTPPINGPTGPEPTPSPFPTPPRIPSADDLIDTGQVLTVSQAGQLIFHFKPGADIGLHRVSVIVGGVQYFFQFWRQNPSAPNNNPGMLRAY